MKKKTIFLASLALIIIIIGIVSFYILFPPQSQVRSRVFGGTVEINIPKDCKRIVFISFAHSGTETKKYLSYINIKDELVTKEYTDYGFFEGKIKWKGFKSNMIKDK